MRRAFRLFFVALLVPATLLAAAPAATPRPSKQYPIEQFMNTIAVGGASFSPDEKEIALTTSTTDTTTAISWFPHDRRFLYTRDQGGNELNHLYVRQKDGSEF